MTQEPALPPPPAAPGEYEVDTSEEAFSKAKARGLVALAPKPNELFVDIDDEQSMEAFALRRAIFDRHILPLPGLVEAVPSKSGRPGKFHITLQLERDITDLERVLFQLMLGSDPVRELLSYRRILNGDPHATLFFELPPAPPMALAPAPTPKLLPPRGEE